MNWEKRERKDFRIKCRCYYCGTKFTDWNDNGRHVCKKCRSERVVFAVATLVTVVVFLCFTVGVILGGGQ